MQANHAAEHLQVIRTLMERSTLYRRALAPMMLLTGAVGTLAAVVGGCLQIGDDQGNAPRFIVYWLVVGVVGLAGALGLVRRQALQAGEPFWSLPMQRVVRAALPAAGSGLVLGLIAWAVLQLKLHDFELWRTAALRELPLAWAVLYGCALHAAGFFMPRGIKWFGWLLVIGGWGLFAGVHLVSLEGTGLRGTGLCWWAHSVMGGFFGLLHLGYGAYLAATEPKVLAA
jgi:hypothetical protein